MIMGRDHLLQMKNINKSFNRVSVLDQANFTLEEGEVHALVGGNGAGKSTLMKILTGVYTKDSGEIVLNGKHVDIRNPQDSEHLGISMIFQELSLIPTLTVAQNIFLTREPKTSLKLLNDKACVNSAIEILSQFQVDIDPQMTVDRLGVGYSQMVEIAKAISKKTKIIIMDEPTAALSDAEIDSLFTLIAKLKSTGISIIYISHRMAEISRICDRITILRDGKTVLTEDIINMSLEKITQTMLGNDMVGTLSWDGREYERNGEPVLSVRNLACNPRVKDVSFDVYPGEIVGIAGLMGSGRTEIAESIFGIRRDFSGEIYANGHKSRTTKEAIASGIAMVPEDRRRQGLVLSHTLKENIMLPSIKTFVKRFFVSDRRGTEIAQKYIELLKVKTDSAKKVVSLLSGGNQQKIVLAKWLARNPKLLILDEPTIGVDIGAKIELIQEVRRLAHEGISILVISSELEELLAISDRILILFGGVINREINRKAIENEEQLHQAVQGL